MLRAFAIAFFTSAVAIGAEAPVAPPAPKEPKSVAAKSAIAKEAHAEAIADAVYRKAILVAKRAEILDLKNAQKGALANNNVDDATLIAGMIKDLESEIVIMEAESAKVTVPANQVIVVRLERGTYRISAAGSWSPGPAASYKATGPAGYGPNDPGGKNLGALAIKVGPDANTLTKALAHKGDTAGETIYTENLTLTLPSGCFVSLRMIDVNPDDNEGSMTVTFTRLP